MEKELRLQKRDDFNTIYRFGKSSANKQFVLYYLSRKHLTMFKVGFSVSKKIGNAVIRNRIRRVLKEIIRLNKDHIKINYSYIIIVRTSCSMDSYVDIERSVINLFRKNSLFIKFN